MYRSLYREFFKLVLCFKFLFLNCYCCCKEKIICITDFVLNLTKFSYDSLSMNFLCTIIYANDAILFLTFCLSTLSNISSIMLNRSDSKVPCFTTDFRKKVFHISHYNLAIFLYIFSDWRNSFWFPFAAFLFLKHQWILNFTNFFPFILRLFFSIHWT
jgi:hypothetical protein